MSDILSIWNLKGCSQSDTLSPIWPYLLQQGHSFHWCHPLCESFFLNPPQQQTHRNPASKVHLTPLQHFVICQRKLACLHHSPSLNLRRLTLMRTHLLCAVIPDWVKRRMRIIQNTYLITLFFLTVPYHLCDRLTFLLTVSPNKPFFLILLWSGILSEPWVRLAICEKGPW